MTIQVEDKTYYELTGQRLPTTSRLRMFPILKEWNDDAFINIFRSYVINSKITEKDDYWTTYTIEETDWWDNISSRYYDTPKLWWVICILNDVSNPYEDLEEGRTIKILRDEYLYIVFNDLNRLALL